MSRNNKYDNMNGERILGPPETSNNLFLMTDSEDSSSSSNNEIYEHHTFVLELHELQRDELPDNPLPEVKTRKLLKKKRPKQLGPEQSVDSPRSSSSESSVVPPGPGELSKEEFYDAHEFPENRPSPAIIGNLGITASPQANDLKATLLTPDDAALPDATSGTPAPDASALLPPVTAISKPTQPSNPE